MKASLPGHSLKLWLRRAACGWIALLVCQALPALSEQFTDSGQCLGCHDTLQHSVSHMAGIRDASGKNRNCVSCHGDSRDHFSRPKKFPPTISFGPEHASPVAQQNDVCLSCHKSERAHWQDSHHDAQGLSCASCHSSHVTRDPVLDDIQQVATCTNCHQRIRAQMNMPSHHPIKTGKTACTDCHSPHGSLNEFALQQPTLNETCFSCHAEKRGPFLFEHSPASEDCAICHKPHGSVHKALLSSRTPFLCQQCHSTAYHPSVALSGEELPGNAASALLLGKNCLNCHSQVHGSNHPSGPWLMR